MSTAIDPSLNRRRLRLELRKAREQADFTQLRAAEALEWSLSKVIRIEAGTVSLSITDLRAMLHLYGVVAPETVAELEAAARGSKGASWWAGYNDVLNPQLVQLLGYEGAANSIRTYHPIVVPGQLQTRDYATALLAPRTSEERVRRVVDLRMERQAHIFDREDVPETVVVLDEAALRRRIGDPQVMEGQLSKLLDISEHPQVTIQVLPFSAGAHFSTLGSFILLGFPGDDDLLYIEYAAGSTASNNDMELISRYQECFATITDAALTGGAAVDLIEQIRAELVHH
jgi:transcriptional regulator with XRE-family HTH domain